MKVYRCDACGITIDDPYKRHMREFDMFISNCDGIGHVVNGKRRVRVDLCNNCFRGLYRIAECIQEKGNGKLKDKDLQRIKDGKGLAESDTHVTEPSGIMPLELYTINR